MNTSHLNDCGTAEISTKSPVALNDDPGIEPERFFDNGSPLISVKQAAALLSVTVGSIYKWIGLRKLPAFRLARKAVRLRMEDVKKFALASRTL